MEKQFEGDQEFSPKLREVMAQLIDICKKEDVAASITLHTPGFGEYSNFIEPSYSIAQDSEEFVRFKTNPEDSKEQKEFKAAATSNMLAIMSESLGQNALGLLSLSELLDKELGAEHSPTKHYPG